jgi:hypothetical protein
VAATEKKNADTVPEPTRAAVAARDTGCRWIGCDAPAAHTEVHHLIERHRGGTHHPDNLISFCRSDHVTAHGRGWTLRLDSDSGALHAHRRGRYKWTTLPRGTPLAQPSDRDPPDDDPGTDAHGDPPPLLSLGSEGGRPATGDGTPSSHDRLPAPPPGRPRAVGVPELPVAAVTCHACGPHRMLVRGWRPWGEGRDVR